MGCHSKNLCVDCFRYIKVLCKLMFDVQHLLYIPLNVFLELSYLKLVLLLGKGGG